MITTYAIIVVRTDGSHRDPMSVDVQEGKDPIEAATAALAGNGVTAKHVFAAPHRADTLVAKE